MSDSSQAFAQQAQAAYDDGPISYYKRLPYLIKALAPFDRSAYIGLPAPFNSLEREDIVFHGVKNIKPRETKTFGPYVADFNVFTDEPHKIELCSMLVEKSLLFYPEKALEGKYMIMGKLAKVLEDHFGPKIQDSVLAIQGAHTPEQQDEASHCTRLKNLAKAVSEFDHAPYMGMPAPLNSAECEDLIHSAIQQIDGNSFKPVGSFYAGGYTLLGTPAHKKAQDKLLEGGYLHYLGEEDDDLKFMMTPKLADVLVAHFEPKIQASAMAMQNFRMPHFRRASQRLRMS